MLVSKIKPCMSKYKLVPSETADGSLNQLWFIGSSLPTWITVVILELIHASKRRLHEGVLLLGTRPARLRPALPGELWITQPIARSSHRRRILRMSALSTFDGTLCAYHGRHG